MRFAVLSAVLLGLTFTAPSVSAQQVTAVRVNGVGISVGEIELRFDETLREKGLHLLQVRDPHRVKQMKHDALNELIDEELLWQAAQKRRAIADDARVDEAFAQAARAAKGEDRLRLRLAQDEISEAEFRERIRRRLSGENHAQSVSYAGVSVSEEDIRAFFDANPAKFQRPEMLRARHILIKVAPDAGPAERAAARGRIQRLLVEARAGKDFADLARTHSEAATKQWDGELDPFARGTLAPEMEKAAFALQPGQVSDVIAAPDGLHIVKLEERIEAVSVPLQEASPRIREYLVAQRLREQRTKLLEELRALADIEVRLPY